MIQSGRRTKETAVPSKDSGGSAFGDGRRSARLTAMLGALVFTVFLCLSAGDGTDSKDVGSTFGEGAYQVFAPSGTDEAADNTSYTEKPKDAMAEEDSSIWSYLESVIARLIYGEP